MAENFKVRVEKTFASLSTQPQIESSSLWSLTDDELRPNTWARESDEPVSDDEDDDVDKDEINTALNNNSFPNDVDRFFLSSANPNPNPNSDGEVTQLPSSSRSCEDDDALDVTNSIGLDSTLDFEEEEDEFDKVAVGKDKPDERLYMSDVSDYVAHDESYNEVPNSFQEASRDPRANHLAANLRLKEDAETARDFNSLHVSEQSSLPVVSGGQSNGHDSDNNIKSILKRKEDQMDSKSEKRVRFDPSCKDNDGDEYEVGEELTLETLDKETNLNAGASSPLKQASLIPDYIRNPSKYTHYTFDTESDMNEASNRQAYADFLGILRKSKHSEPDEAPADLSKPVMFNPKKKSSDAKMTSNERDRTMESVDRKKSGVPVAVISELEDEACEMEVDEQATFSPKAGNVKKSGRQYRSKPSLEYDESDA
ncbi:hypothetical protein vseg_004859 [Gypsophila vaccaria]